MNTFSTAALLHLFATMVQALTYTAAAVYANLAEPHHDLCPFYATAAIAGFVIVGVVYNDERSKSSDLPAGQQ